MVIGKKYVYEDLEDRETPDLYIPEDSEEELHIYDDEAGWKKQSDVNFSEDYEYEEESDEADEEDSEEDYDDPETEEEYEDEEEDNEEYDEIDDELRRIEATDRFEDWKEDSEKVKKIKLTNLIATAVFILLAGFFIKVIFFTIAYVPTASMEPTIMTGQYILGYKNIPIASKVRRGDIIVFVYPKEPDKLLVKRVIGLPGETITVINDHVYIDNNELDEPYLRGEGSWNLSKRVESYKVPSYGYFVLGDNRVLSEDSRYWGFVPKKNIKAKVFFNIGKGKKGGDE